MIVPRTALLYPALADDEDIKCVADSTRTSNGRKVRSGELHPRPRWPPPRAASPLSSAKIDAAASAATGRALHEA